MPYRRRFLDLDDDELLAQCQVHRHRSSGPGGQHRNKVSSAVRLLHRPTGMTARAAESRLQRENQRRALARLRMKIACQVRCPLDLPAPAIPPALAECIFAPRPARPRATRRLQIGRKDRRFWQVAAVLLDLLEACQGRLAPAAAYLGITTTNLASVLKADRHLLAAAQQIRRTFGRGRLK